MAENIELLYEKLSKRENINLPDLNTFKQRYSTSEGMDLLYSKMSKMSDINLPDKEVFKSRYLPPIEKPVEEPVEEQGILDKYFGRGSFINDYVIESPLNLWKWGKELVAPVKIQDKQKVESEIKDQSPNKGGMSYSEFNDKLFNSASRGIQFSMGVEKDAADVASLDFLKKIGYESQTSKDGKIEFVPTGKTFSEEEKQQLLSEKTNIVAGYNKQIEELKKQTEGFSNWTSLGVLFNVIRAATKTDEREEQNKKIREEIKQLEEDKQIISSAITEQIGDTKSFIQKPNSDTGVIATEPTRGLNPNDIESISYNFTSANTDLKNANEAEKIAQQPGTANGFKQTHLLGYVERGLEMMYSANPVELDLKKSVLLNGIEGDGEKPVYEQQQAMFVAAKSEQKDLVSKIQSLSELKQNIDNNINKYLEYINKGSTLTKEQNEELKRLSALSSNLETNVSLQKERVGLLQSLIDNNSSTYKNILAEQYKYDGITELLPGTTAFMQGLGQIASIPSRIGRTSATLIASAVGEKEAITYTMLKDSPEFRYKKGDEFKTIEEAGSISLIDENGNFKLDVFAPGLIYQSTKVFGESMALGAGMLATRAGIVAPIERKIGQWATSQAMKGSELVGASTGKILQRATPEITKTLLMGTGTEAAFASPLYLAETMVGSVAPSILLFGDEMIKNQIKQGLTIEQSTTVGLLLASIEGMTERLFPNEMNMVKYMIGKGEIKTLKDLAENATYKKAVQETYKQMTNKPLTQGLYKMLLGTGNFIKGAVPVGLEETAEEVAGLGMQATFVNPIAKSYSPEYQGEEFTPQAITNTAIATMATMLPMMGQAGMAKVSQYNQAQKSAQFTVGQNPSLYLDMTLTLFKEGAISEQEFQRRSQLIDKHKQNYQQALTQSLTKSFVNNYTEDQFKNYTFKLFDNISTIENLKKSVVDNPEDEKVFQLYEQENLNLQTLLEKGLFKSEEERIENTKNSLNYYITPETVENYTKEDAQSTVEKLKGYYASETDVSTKAVYDEKVQLLNQRIDALKKEEEEAKKTEVQKAKESEVRGSIQIPTSKGNRSLEIGKKYILNRQLNFKDSKNPIRFPEITFLGYKKDEQGNIIEQDGSPVVILETKNTKGQKMVAERPVSAFKDYILTTEEIINSSPQGKFYNKYKNKKFEISLSRKDNEGKQTPNRFFNLLNKSFAVTQDDVIEGALSVENVNGKLALIFNFIAKDKKGNEKEGSIELTDYDIKQAQKFGGKSYGLRPKLKTYINREGKEVKEEGQYQNLSLEEVEELVGFTEEEQKQYEQYLESQDFEDLRKRRLLQESRRREYIQDYIKKISTPLTKILEQIENLTKQSEEYSSFLEVASTTKSLLNITRFSEITDEQVQKLLPVAQFKKYKNLQTSYQKLSFLKDYLDKKTEQAYKKTTSISDKLSILEAKKEQYQSVIDAELEFLETIEVEQLDYTTSITTQLKQKRKALKDLLKEKEQAFSSARTLVDNLLEAIETVKDVIDNLFTNLQSLINPESTQESRDLLNSELNSLNSQLSATQENINKIAEEKQKISLQIKKLNNLIKYLSDIENSFQQEMKDLDSQRLKEFILKENNKIPSTETETNTVEEDKQLEDKTTKKYLSVLFSSSTSWGYNYEGKLQEPTNNFANARLDFFLNNQKSIDDVVLLPITKKNAKRYNLEGILTPGMEDVDIQLVPVKLSSDNTFVFLDMKGQPIETPSPNNVIYTPLPLINSTEDLVDSEGRLKYNPSELENMNEEQQKKYISSLVLQFKQFREQILSNESPSTLPNVQISRGIPEYSGSVDEQFVRNPVRGTLVPSTLLTFKGGILIATKSNTEGSKTGTVQDHSGNNVNVPLGRPILFNKSLRTFQFLDNHKLSPAQKEAVKNAIYNIALKTRENFKKSSVEGALNQSILDTDIINYLRGIVYWRNPNRLVNNKKQANPSRNQMWIDYNSQNELSLFYGNNGVHITFKNIIESEGNHEALSIIVDELFHNINSDNLEKPYVEYYIKDGKTEKRDWKYYEDYLLSEKNPDGTSRDINEIPLTTNLIPNSSPFDENNNFDSTYNPQYRSRYFTFKSPVKPITTAPEEKPEQKEQPSPAQSSKQPLNVKVVEDFIQAKIDASDNEDDKNYWIKTFDFWKSVGQELKDGRYSISSQNPKTNEGNPFYSFTVNIKDGKINISDVEVTVNDTVKGVFERNGVEITEANIKEILDFVTYKVVTLSPSSIPFFHVGKRAEYTPLEKEEVKFYTAAEALKGFEEAEKKEVSEKKSEVKKIIKRKPSGNSPNSGYRIAKGQANQKINIEKARQWFKQRFPQLNFNVVSELIDGVAWGKFVKNGIILSEAAEIGTEYHEAFEAVAGLFLNRREWNTLKSEFKSRKGSYIDRETGKVTLYSEATDHQIKEELAEEYRTYELSGGKERWEGEYRKNSIFRTIYNHIKSLLFGDVKEINEVFDRISKAYYKDKSPVKWNRPFNLDKSYKIANLQDDLFFKHANQSLSYYTFAHIFSKGKNLSELFKADKKYFENLYANVRRNIADSFLKVEDGNILEDYDYNNLQDLVEDYNNFFEEIINNYNDGYAVPTSFSELVNTTNTNSDEELYQVVYNKYKDHLLSLQYMLANWEEVIQQHKEYLNKFKIGYEGEIEDVDIEEIEDNEQEGVTTEEIQNSVGRDEYTKDPFSLFLKNTANNRVKFLIATLPKAKIVEGLDKDNLQNTQILYNSLGLPEPTNFSKTFRKVVSIVINDNNILEMLESIKKAIPNNPEFKNLYKRLGGHIPFEKLTKDEFELRLSFEQSFSKQRVEFSRLLLREIEKGKGKDRTYNLISNLINSLKSSGVQSITNRYIQNLKFIAADKGWIEEDAISIPNTDVPKDSKDINKNVEFLKSVGFDIPYNVDNLSPTELSLAKEAITEIVDFIRSNNAKLEQLRYFNFSDSVRKLAEAEIEITKDSNEVQHRNIDNQPQSNDISINAFTETWKTLNKILTLDKFIEALPRFNDIYTQNAFWRQLYFTNGERNDIKYRMESAEGVIYPSNKGKHTSKLPLNLRFLQEFIYNIYNDKKGFRTPGFYAITPADIKTEFVHKWGQELVDRIITQDTNTFFNFIAKGYLIDEINLAKELSVDDRSLKSYNKPVQDTAYVKNRKVKNSLRFFHDILKFDYTDVIDNPIDVEEWIEFNKDTIISNLNDFIEQGVEEVFFKFQEEQIITPVQLGKNSYFDFYGLDENMMNWIDGKFGTSLVDSNKRWNKTLFTEGKLKELIRYRNVNYFVNINEQSKLFLGDIGQYSDLTKRAKSFISTREATSHDTPLTNGEVFTTLAKKFYNTSTFTDTFGNTREIQLSPETPGYQEFTNEFSATTIDDAIVIQTSISSIQDKHKEEMSSSLFFSDFQSLPQKVKDYISKKVAKVTKPFTEVNEADAQAYMALPLYRQFLLRSSMWSDELEDLYQFHMAYERIKRDNYPDTDYGNSLKEIDELIVAAENPNIQRVKQGLEPTNFPIIKPIGAGVRPGDKFISTLDKNSVAPLFYQMLEGKPSLQTYLSAIDNNDQYFRFVSAHKTGTPVNIAPPYDYNGNPTSLTSTDQLSFSDFGIQVETRGSKNKVTRGTQSLKIPLLNLFQSGVPNDYVKTFHSQFQEQINNLKQTLEEFNPSEYFKQWSDLNSQIINTAKNVWDTLTKEEKNNISPAHKAVQEHNDVISSLTERYFEQISEEFSLERQKNGTVRIKDFTKFKESLHKQLKDRDAANNLIAQIEVENGKMVQPFDFIIGADKLEPILYSILNKNVVQPKINGRALAQIASTFFENSSRTYVKKVEQPDGLFTYEEVSDPYNYPNKEELILTSNELLFYGDLYVEDKNGNTRKATQQEIEKGAAKEANFIEVYLPQIFKDKLNNYITDKGKIDPSLLQAVGFRIPTQELSSMENIRIKGFLPLEIQNGVVVPSSITAKAGSDFDIDKLNIYLYHYQYSARQDKVIKVPYLDDSNSTVEYRYELLHKKYTKQLAYLDNIISLDYEKNVLFNEADPTTDKLWTAIFGRLNQDLSEYTDEEVSEVLEEKGYTLKHYKDLVKKQELEKVNAPAFEEFKQFPIDKQNTTKALENKYIESIQTLLTLPENFTRLTNPNSADTLKELANMVDGLKGITKEKQQFAQYLSPIKNAITRYSFQIGKEGVGIGAVGMTNEAVNQIVNSYISDPSVWEISLVLPTNQSISFTRDRDGGFISDNISEFINAFVDVAKDPFIIRINGNLSTAGSYIVANKIGIPLENMTLLMNQPIITDYEKYLEYTSSPIGRTRLKSENSFSQKYIISKIKDKYGVLSDDYTPYIIPIKELEDMITSPLGEKENQHQLYLLETYKKIKNLSENLRDAVSTYNYDTDQPKFITDVFAKTQREQKYLKNPKVIIPTSDTFFQTIKDTTLDYTEALLPLFQSFSSAYYPFFFKIQQRIALINDSNQRQRALAEIKKGLANFLLLTYNNFQIQNQLSNILLNDNLIKEIKILKSKMEKGEIEENFAISELFPLPADKINKKTFNLTLFNKESSGEYIDLIANSLKQLQLNPEYSLLAKKIYALSLLQSGLNTSYISLSQFIPHETFTELAKSVTANPNTTMLPYFEQMFYANKWKDNKFTLQSPRRPEVDTNISSKPIILLKGVSMDETGKPQLNTRNYSYFQLGTYSLIESDNLSKKWETRIFQRVEDSEGEPILIQSNDSYNFIYREVTPLGDGQNALEYSLTSQLNKNVESQSQQEIIANVQANFPNTSFTLSELLEEKSKPKTELASQQHQIKEIPTQEVVDNNQLQKPKFRIPMNFEDGTGGRQMRDEFKGKSTLELIKEGNRTATSRDRSKSYNQQDIKVGDIVEFYADSGKSKGKTVLVKVTKAPYKLSEITAEEWSKLEGWKPTNYEKLKSQGYEQFQYELLNTSQVVDSGIDTKSGFQGYKGGFEDKGKGTPQGDGKDKAMREVADGFIGEYKNKNSSTYTSAKQIADKTSFELFDRTQNIVGGEFGKIVMLARNSEFFGKPLSHETKESIRDAKSQKSTFVVGDMPGVDSQFIDYLQEIGAKFTIYHTGNQPRIKISKHQEQNITGNNISEQDLGLNTNLTQEDIDRLPDCI